MPYQRSDRRLTWSGFDIGGEHAAEDDRLKAAHVHGPAASTVRGETARLFGIVRRGGLQAPCPVHLSSSGLTMHAAARCYARGRPCPPTAYWPGASTPAWSHRRAGYQANVYLIDSSGQSQALGGTSFSVEDYQPDRLRIRTAVEREPRTRLGTAR